MLIIFLDSLCFSGLVWEFTLLPSTHTETSMGFARPFPSTVLRATYWLVGQYVSKWWQKMMKLHYGIGVETRVTRLYTGWYKVWFSSRQGNFLSNFQTGRDPHPPVSYSMGIGGFFSQGIKLITHLYLVSRWRISGVTPLWSLCSAQHRLAVSYQYFRKTQHFHRPGSSTIWQPDP